MKGHWIGLFSSHNGITSIDFTENITPKKFFMKPFVKRYLKKQQAAYINSCLRSNRTSILITIPIIQDF